uniref:Uncharacterized protein LOC8258533 isoform X5 n=1 Tax=Rhizophora mucronata TaxID=61149 RepID=A0A2P2KWL0_RHIMU
MGKYSNIMMPTPQAKTNNSDMETHIMESYFMLHSASSSKEAAYSICSELISSLSSNSDSGWASS